MNSKAKRLRSKLGWQSDEEKLIECLVETQGMCWKGICQIINQKFPERKRNPKQCRQRYNNYIKFQKNKRNTQNWDSVEQEKLLQLYMKFGSRWTQISNQLHDRSPNEVKNKFYGSIRRFVRRINEILRGNQLKTCKKPISYETLIRLLSSQTPMTNSNLEQVCSKLVFIKNLKERILQIVSNTSYGIQYDEAEGLAEGLVQFNIMTRADRLRELKTSKKEKKQRLKLKNSPQIQKSTKIVELTQNSDDVVTINKESLDQQKQNSQQELENYLFQSQNQHGLMNFDDEINEILGIHNRISNQFIEYL